MPLPEGYSILRQFDLETAVDRVHGSRRMQQTTSEDPSVLLRTWLALLPREVTSRLELALQQAIPFMPPDFTPEVVAVANDNVSPLTHIDVICVSLHFAMESHNYQMAAALIFTIDRALYRLGWSKPLLQVVKDLHGVSPGTAVAPQVTLRQARVKKDQGDLNGALRVIHAIINREDGWQYPEERQYMDTKAACLHVQGQIYHNLELWHSAIPPLVEGYQIFCQVQDRKGISSVLHVLSRCLCRLQQQQYDQFRLSHPGLFLEADPCYEGYRQGKAAVHHVQHTDDSFFVVKHQLVADESLLMFAIQNPCVVHFQHNLRQILQEIHTSLGGCRSVRSLQNVESFVEFVRAVFLASLVLFHSRDPADITRAVRLERLSLGMYAAMCCGDRDTPQSASSTKQTTQSSSFRQTAESVGLMNEALALLGLTKLQWKDGGDNKSSSPDTSLKSLPSDLTNSRVVLDDASREHQESGFPCSSEKPKPENDAGSNRPSDHGGSDWNGKIEIDEAESSKASQSAAVYDTPGFNPSGGHLTPEISNSCPRATPQGIKSDDHAAEQSNAFHVINKSVEVSRYAESQSDDVEPEKARESDSYKQSSYDVDSCSEPIEPTSCDDNENQGKAAVDHHNKSASPSDSLGELGLASSDRGNVSMHKLKDHDDLSESREIPNRFSTQTSPAHDISPDSAETHHVESMTTSARHQQGHLTASTEYSARAATVPARLGRNQRGRRGGRQKQDRERFVGLVMSREELRAATWPALSLEAENSLEDDDDCTEQEEEEDLDALSISTNDAASSGKNFIKETASSEYDIIASVSTDCNQSGDASHKKSSKEAASSEYDIISSVSTESERNKSGLTSPKSFTKETASSEYDIIASVSTDSNKSGDDSSFNTYKLPPMIPPFIEEKSQLQTRHICSSCIHSKTGCSTVDQNATTKSSPPQSPGASVSSLLPQSQENGDDHPNSDSLLSGLSISQELEDEQQTDQKEAVFTWEPSQLQQVHRAQLMTFDVSTGSWRRQSTLIHMGAALPLANTRGASGDGDPQSGTRANPRGAFRDAFIVSFLHQGEPLARYVGKKYRKKRPPKEYMRDVTDQMMASYYVTVFNDELSRHQSEYLTIHFLPAFHLRVFSSEGLLSDWLNVEPYMDGRYDKITNNAGYVASHRPHLLTGTQVATAFSHFSYVRSQGCYMVVDLQGCVPDDNKGVIYLTDPVLHSTGREGKERSSPFDRHTQGMEDFFRRAHTECNDICRLLHLDQCRPF
ncbi:hypothetical protein ACOMHN_026093 [Nucella lapillus]